MRNLELLIRSAKEDDANAMLEIIEKFQPLINKYVTKARYNEDVKSELELKLIELVKCEIQLDKLRDLNEGTLVKYIASSLYHRYIALSRGNSAKSKAELLYEDDACVDSLATVKFSGDTSIEEGIFYGLLRSILTEREFYCVCYIEIMGHTAEELAKVWHNSKQAVNQCKRRAFGKIRKYYEDAGRRND